MSAAPNGRKIPVNREPDPNGQLMVDESTGWLVRAYDAVTETTRYRSHLLDCRSLARALHDTRTIKLVKSETCSFPNCDFTGEHSHVHCFKCGDTGHFAANCESESEVAELVFE